MRKSSVGAAASEEIRALAEFRFLLRKFLQFSENAAVKAGLTPQQHQLLLQIAGAPRSAVTSIGYLAERLALRHNSVVELATRCEEAGLVARSDDPENRRHVVLKMTVVGSRILGRLSADHARELHELGPMLVARLGTFTVEEKKGMRAR